MISKEWLADAMVRDCKIFVHLHSKTPADLQDWRPSPSQRTVMELLRYVAVSPISYLKNYLEPEAGWRDKYLVIGNAVTFDEFPARMGQTQHEILEFFQEVSAEALIARKVKTPAGEEMPLAQAILNGPLKWLPAYKMQLFLYLKQNGIQLGTPNLWRGVDPVA